MAELIGVLGTGNPHKIVELLELLAASGISWKSLADFPSVPEVPETGSTFAENARLKACEYARALGHWVLAEDAGLVVDALGGEPGVFSARYAGEPRDDRKNIDYLLERLKTVPQERRTARFVCHMVLADPAGQVRAESVGICRGRITDSPRGIHGFGYDPVFEVPEYHRTFAELGPAVKSCLSHRARAVYAILPEISRLVRTGEWQAALTTARK